ncbi:MAG: porin family protein [Candidatus Aminicenantes bacterium]|nr:porin family protein [Candidatus Aminicenantes bacterium]
MKKKNFFQSAIILIFIMSIPVSAKITSNYLYLGAGFCQLAKEIQIPGENDIWVVQTDTQSGLYPSIGAGHYDNWGHFRVEFDISYRRNSISDIEIVEMDVVGLSIKGGEGDVTTLSFLLNGWYDLDITERWTVYFGGGLGVGRISLEKVYIETAPVVSNPKVTKTLYIDDSDWKFAMQAGAGITFALSSAFFVDLGYRYFLTSDPHFITEMDYEFMTDMHVNTFSLSLKFLY